MKISWNILLTILVLNSCTNLFLKKNTEQEKGIVQKQKELNVEQGKEIIELEEPKMVEFKTEHTFSKYKIEKYKGLISPLNFEQNPFADDDEYVKFITRGCQEHGINFGGKYTIITRSCGMECTHLFMVNRKNGQIFTEIGLSEGKYGYEFKADSRLLIANSYLFKNDSFNLYEEHYHWKPELYEWENDKFEKLK